MSLLAANFSLQMALTMGLCWIVTARSEELCIFSCRARVTAAVAASRIIFSVSWTGVVIWRTFGDRLNDVFQRYKPDPDLER